MSGKLLVCLSRYFVPAIIVICLLTLLIPVPVVRADSIVTFPDSNLEAAIREAIGKPSGDISQSDLVGLTDLWAGSCGITNLTGLEHCTNLSTLYLEWNDISDISPLSGLTSLDQLSLMGNQISDLSPLSGLTSLTGLSLDWNQVSDLSPLSGFTSLTWLYLGENQISDLSHLSGLINLERLYLWDNHINDISSLTSLTSLSELFLSGNQISDISHLGALTSLTDLSLGDNQITGISHLDALSGLEYLDLWWNQISDISSLASLISLRWLDLGYNQIADISHLDALTSLTCLYLDDNHISDIEPLVNNTGLASGDIVDLRGNPLNSASHIIHIPALQERGVEVYCDPPNQPPHPPNNQSPAPGATGVSITPTLQSSPFSDPDTGDIHAASRWQIRTSSGNYENAVYDSGRDIDNLTTITVPSGNLDYNTTYHWRVMHQDNRGDWSGWSLETSFTTSPPPNQPPDQPGNISPRNGAAEVSLTPTLETSAFSDPDSGHTHAASRWQIRTSSSDYQNALYDSGRDIDNLTTITVPSGSLDYNTTYHWRVMHQDNRGDWSGWSLETSFTTICDPVTQITPPTTPVVTIEGHTTTNTSQLYAAWTASDPESGIVEYQYAIGTSPGEDDVIGWTSAGTSTEITRTRLDLTVGATYYFSVKAKNGAGLWSDVGVSHGILVEAHDEHTLNSEDEDGLNGKDSTRGEVGSCCAPSNAKASASDLALVWGVLGLSCGTGFLLANRLGKRRKE